MTMNESLVNTSLYDNETIFSTISIEDVDDAWEFQFRDLSRFLVHRFFVPIVVFIGVLGNLVTIYILTRRPMRSSTNVYLCALAVSDCLFLVFTFTLSLSHYGELTSTWWLYWFYKPIGLWLNDASSATSVWLTVSFTIERYIAVCHPMRGKVLCTEERAMKVAILVYIVCFLVTSPTPFEWTIVSKVDANNTTNSYDLENTDFGKNEAYVLLYYWFHSIIFTIFPVLILIIFNYLLILAVRQSRMRRKEMTNLTNSSVRHIQAMRQENRITITLIAVVIVFLMCQLPTATFLIYSSFNQEETKRQQAFSRGIGGVFNLLVSINAACNFLLYTALSDKYRKYFCTFFFCWTRIGRNQRNLQQNYENTNEMNNPSIYGINGVNYLRVEKRLSTCQVSPKPNTISRTCDSSINTFIPNFQTHHDLSHVQSTTLQNNFHSFQNIQEGEETILHIQVDQV